MPKSRFTYGNKGDGKSDADLRTNVNTVKIIKVKENYQSCTEQIKFDKPHHDCIWIAYSIFVGLPISLYL